MHIAINIFVNYRHPHDHLAGLWLKVGEKRGEPMMSLRSCQITSSSAPSQPSSVILRCTLFSTQGGGGKVSLSKVHQDLSILNFSSLYLLYFLWLAFAMQPFHQSQLFCSISFYDHDHNPPPRQYHE